MQTVWQSETLRFRPIRSEDLDAIVPMLARSEVCAQVFYGPNTAEETRAYFTPHIEQTAAALAEGRLPESPVFSIRRVADGAFLGECALIAALLSPGVYEVGYQLDAPYWRRGYGREACEFLVGLAFAALGARRLDAGCMATNTGSRRILEHCGFTHEGTQRQRFDKGGELRDNRLYGLLRAEVDGDRLATWGKRYRDI